MKNDLRDEFSFSEKELRVAELTLSSETIEVQVQDKCRDGWICRQVQCMTETSCTCLALLQTFHSACWGHLLLR